MVESESWRISFKVKYALEEFCSQNSDRHRSKKSTGGSCLKEHSVSSVLAVTIIS